MKVADLKELLADFPDDMDILMSIDAEGNAYNFLRVVEVAKCVEEDRYFYPLHPEDEEEYEGYDLLTMLVLWP